MRPRAKAGTEGGLDSVCGRLEAPRSQGRLPIFHRDLTMPVIGIGQGEDVCVFTVRLHRPGRDNELAARPVGGCRPSVSLSSVACQALPVEWPCGGSKADRSARLSAFRTETCFLRAASDAVDVVPPRCRGVHVGGRCGCVRHTLQV